MAKSAGLRTYQIKYLEGFIARWEDLWKQKEGASQNVQEGLLIDEYQSWLKWQRLPQMSADELLNQV